MFSDVIVCKTYKDFEQQEKIINQQGIGNDKRKVVIRQDSSGHIAFYIFFKHPDENSLVVFMHKINDWDKSNPKQKIFKQKIDIQSDTSSCGVVALECIKHLTYDW